MQSKDPHGWKGIHFLCHVLLQFFITRKIAVSRFFHRCCGLKGNYLNLVKNIKATEISFNFNCIDISKRIYELCCSDLKDYITHLNKTFVDIDKEINDHTFDDSDG